MIGRAKRSRRTRWWLLVWTYNGVPIGVWMTRRAAERHRRALVPSLGATTLLCVGPR